MDEGTLHERCLGYMRVARACQEELGRVHGFAALLGCSVGVRLVRKHARQMIPGVTVLRSSTGDMLVLPPRSAHVGMLARGRLRESLGLLVQRVNPLAVVQVVMGAARAMDDAGEAKGDWEHAVVLCTLDHAEGQAHWVMSVVELEGGGSTLTEPVRLRDAPRIDLCHPMPLLTRGSA
jgi:hypothetical protein